MGTHRYNNIDTAFKATIKEENSAGVAVIVDISAATTKQLTFRRPDGTEFTKTATFLTDGTDGIIQYVTVDGDLNMIGEWTVTGKVSVGGWTGYSHTDYTFTVKRLPG